MFLLAVMLVCNLSSGHFCYVDSVLYAIDPADHSLQRRALPSPVIGISSDVSAFVLTARYLYKVTCPGLAVEDRILLPQRFNHIITHENDIILVGTNEIILVDKQSLTFRTGIGIEQGDYQPLAVCRQGGSGDQKYIYLLTNSGGRSTLKVFDLFNGTLKKKISGEPALYTRYDAQNNIIAILDSARSLTLYDMDLRTLQRIAVPPNPLFFLLHENGFVVYCRNGMFFIDRSGTLIDFQPISLTDHSIGQPSIHITADGVAALDLYTVRPKAFGLIDRTFTYAYTLNDSTERYGLLLDETAAPYLLDTETMKLRAISSTSMIAQAPLSVPRPTHQDSLWYFQLGAFVHYENALDLYATMKSRNLPVFIDSSDLYRIKLGGFHDKEPAMSALELTDLAGWFILQERVAQSGTATFFLGGYVFVMKDGIIERRSP
jgi:hypothetical protein